MAKEKSKTAMGMILSYVRALSEMYQHMHWRTSGTNYYGDHLLFDRLYGETNEEKDLVAEKTVGLFNDADTIAPNSDMESSTKILQSLVSDQDQPDVYADKAIKAEHIFIELIAKTKQILESEDGLSDGVDNMLQGIADAHEGHLYLLQQRTGNKDAKSSTGSTVLARLFKLAYSLDKKGQYDEAVEIEAAMKILSERVGLAVTDMVSLADHFDREGDTNLADCFDTMAKSAVNQKKKTT